MSVLTDSNNINWSMPQFYHNPCLPY